MSSTSDSRASSSGDLGAGGKLVRRPRRRPPGAATPYRRPEGHRRGWLSGLVSRAGSLLSAVFLPAGRGESETSGSEAESEEGDDIRGHSDGHQVDAGEELIEDQRVDVKPSASKSPTKLVIEQLIQKENFTWDESNQLIGIIQSRIVDSPMQERAIMEAKKWVEEKRSGISSRAAQISGSCTINKDWYLYGHENERGSPVDMAKSYMQALPPWSSPASGFGTPSIRACCENFESSCAPSNPALASLQDLKRKFNSSGTYNNLDTTPGMHREDSKETPVCLDFTQSETVNKIFEHQCLENPVVVDGQVQPPPMVESTAHVTCPQEPVTGSWNLATSSKDISDMNLGCGGGEVFTLPLETEIQIEVVSSQQEILVSGKVQDVICNNAPDQRNLDSLQKDQKGLVEDFMNAEPISMVPENDNPTLPGIGEIINLADSGNSHSPEDLEKENSKREEDNSRHHSSPVSEVFKSDARPSHTDLNSDKGRLGPQNTTPTDGAFSIPSSSSTRPKAAPDSSHATPNIEIDNPTPTGNGAIDYANAASGSPEKNLRNGPARRARPTTYKKSRGSPSRQSTRVSSVSSDSPSQGRKRRASTSGGPRRTAKSRMRGRGK